jgi:hypothetical protein
MHARRCGALALLPKPPHLVRARSTLAAALSAALCSASLQYELQLVEGELLRRVGPAANNAHVRNGKVLKANNAANRRHGAAVVYLSRPRRAGDGSITACKCR